MKALKRRQASPWFVTKLWRSWASYVRWPRKSNDAPAQVTDIPVNVMENCMAEPNKTGPVGTFLCWYVFKIPFYQENTFLFLHAGKQRSFTLSAYFFLFCVFLELVLCSFSLYFRADSVISSLEHQLLQPCENCQTFLGLVIVNHQVMEKLCALSGMA